MRQQIYINANANIFVFGQSQVKSYMISYTGLLIYFYYFMKYLIPLNI